MSNATLLEISCRGSYIIVSMLITFEPFDGADIIRRISAKKRSLTDSFSDGSPGEWNLINDKPNVFV